MLRNLIAIVVSILLVSAPGVSLAADVRSFDIMGMKLGMSVAEIEAAAVGAGLLEKGRTKAPSFDQAVQIRKGQQIGGSEYKGVRKLRFAAGPKHLEIDFAATRQGARAYMIVYVDTNPGLSPTDMSVSVEAKYGQPDQRGTSTWIWGDLQPLPLRTAASLDYDIEPISAVALDEPTGRLTLRDPHLPNKSRTAIADAAS